MSHLEEICWLLPDHLYGVVGTELAVYWESAFYSTLPLEAYHFDVTSGLPADANAQHMQERWRITPSDANVGSGAVTFEAYYDGVSVCAKTVTVTIVPKIQPAPLRQLLVIGDSIAASGNWLSELQHLLGDSLITLGTYSAQAFDAGETTPVLIDPVKRLVYHQAKSGRTVAWFCGDYGVLTGVSPFVFEEQFDFGWYLSHNAITLYPDDFVMINLGSNDVYPFTNDADAVALNETAFAQLEQMVASIHAAVPEIRIGLGMMTASAYSQDAFAPSQGSRQTRWRFSRNRMLWLKRMLLQFGGRESDRIYLVPVHTGLDVKNNMGSVNEKINARNKKTWDRQNDHLHPALSGYYQLADGQYEFLMGNWDAS